MKTQKTAKPCKKCPYKLGLVKFVQNPCLDCMENNYSVYKNLVKISNNSIIHQNDFSE